MAGEDDCKVEAIEAKVGYKGFFRIGVHTLRHERFDGTMSPELTREVFERGNAVAVLPYDPVRDTVLLIRQFRPGAWAAGRPARPLQAIAGMVDKANEDSAEVARREAGEEAGLTIGDVIPAQAFLPSPGGSSERIETFLARADLSDAGGIHGLAEESEDIKVEVMSVEEALSRLDRGEIEAGPAVVLLLWFARHHDRFRRAWTTGSGPFSA
jgi:ADP-ribose pyrophosphatase